jgi:hypothetical protein
MENPVSASAEVGPAAIWAVGLVAAVIVAFVIYLGLALVAVLRARPDNMGIRYKVFRDLLNLWRELLALLLRRQRR